jgi:hypothetical protein
MSRHAPETAFDPHRADPSFDTTRPARGPANRLHYPVFRVGCLPPSQAGVYFSLGAALGHCSEPLASDLRDRDGRVGGYIGALFSKEQHRCSGGQAGGAGKLVGGTGGTSPLVRGYIEALFFLRNKVDAPRASGGSSGG